MVRIVSSSAGEGPGPVISRGFTERRAFKSSIASGTMFLSSQPDVRQTDKRALRQAEAQFGAILVASVRRCFQSRPPHIRRNGFLDQRRDGLVGWHHLLPVAAEAADRDRMRLRFLLA